ASDLVAQDAQHQVEAVGTGAQAELRLVRVLGRQRVGLVVGDVRRVAHDQVVVLAAQTREQVRLQQAQVVRAEPRLVLARQRQRQIGRGDAVHVPGRV